VGPACNSDDEMGGEGEPGSEILDGGGASLACDFSSSFGWETDDSFAKASAPERSSPGSAITAIGVPTAIFFAPSSEIILARTPSSCASTSIVALSVS
jgi:hypothetical protein